MFIAHIGGMDCLGQRPYWRLQIGPGGPHEESIGNEVRISKKSHHAECYILNMPQAYAMNASISAVG